MTRKTPKDSRPTLVSLFTGAGGLDIGLELAGFRTVAALDSDEDCVSTLRLNQEREIPIPCSTGKTQHHFLEGAKILGARVEEISAADLRPARARGTWVPDLLAGGPPCQPFSSAGKQLALDDPRGRLFEHFVRLAEELSPRMILFENVRGLVTAPGPTGKPGEALALVEREFERIGYATTFALINTADYGAPQRRVRLIMLGTKQSPLPEFPAATHAEAADGELRLFGRREPWVTLGRFLANQPPPEADDIERPSPALAAKLASVGEGSGLKSPGARESTRPGGHWGYKQGTFIANLSLPARTVTAAATQDWIRSAQGLRRLTWSECAGLQGFPASWKFVGNKVSRFRQIGNAVPVLLGKVLGESLLRALSRGDAKNCPKSAPWPATFHVSIRYTEKEQKRNGESRKSVRRAIEGGDIDVLAIKGLGSSDSRRTESEA